MLPSLHASSVIVLVLAAGCSIEGQPPAERGTETPDVAQGAAQAEPAATADALATSCARPLSPDRRDAVCQRWRCDGRDAVRAATWSGDAATCAPGDLDVDAGQRATILVN